MSNVDRAIFDKVVKECTKIRPKELENVLHKINTAYAKRKRWRQNEEIDFEYIRDKVLEHCGLYNLFHLEEYKSAVGKYYSRRRAANAKAKQEARKLVGKVSYASKHAVTIRATVEVSITFKALNQFGKLSFKDVDTGRKRFIHFGERRDVPEDVYLSVKRQALKIMNRKRGYH